MDSIDLFSELQARTSAENAERILRTFNNAGLTPAMSFLKAGQSTSVFDIDNSNIVFKIFDRRLRKNPRINSSRFLLRDNYRRLLRDKDGVEVVLELEPKLTHTGVTPLHQEMLRYQLWVNEHRDFWDILPPPSNPKEIKNTLLDYRGVPYIIDEDAVKEDHDIFHDYPIDSAGHRTDEQYLRYRANSFNNDGKPDIIADKRFAEIVAACQRTDWPADQKPVFAPYINHEILGKYTRAIQSIGQKRALRCR